MNTFVTAFLIASPFLIIAAAVIAGNRSMKKTGSGKTALKKHFMTLAVAVSLVAMFTIGASAATGDTGTAAAAADAAAKAGGDAGLATGLAFIAAALATGLSGIGAGLALAAGAPAAIGATSEDPKAFGKAIIFVALGEAVALYGLIVALLIVTKIPTLPAL